MDYDEALHAFYAAAVSGCVSRSERQPAKDVARRAKEIAEASCEALGIAKAPAEKSKKVAAPKPTRRPKTIKLS